MARSLSVLERRPTLVLRGRTGRLPPKVVAAVPDLLGAAAVVALGLINLIGPLGVLLFVTSTAALIAWRPLYNINQLLRFSPLLLLPILAIVSTLWSDAPQRTMRAALQLLLTIVASIVVCRNVKPERFLLALFAYLLLAVLTIAPDIPGAFISKVPLSAWWGAKNSVAFAGYQLFAVSIAVAVDRHHFWAVRLLALGGAALGLPVEYLAQSGGSAASTLITLLIFPPLVMLGLFKLPTRLALVGFTSLTLLVSSFFLNDIDQAVTAFRSGVLNKDATLTGRTYLWDFADRLAGDRPMLGAGYWSFWRIGNIDAEGLWRWGGISNRMGFNFHNAFVGMRVELGWVGVAILVAMCVAVLGVALIRQIVSPNIALTGLITITAVNYVRSYVEEGLIAPFSLVTLTWLATLLFAVPRDEGGAVIALRRRRTARRKVDIARPERWRSAGPRRWS